MIGSRDCCREVQPVPGWVGDIDVRFSYSEPKRNLCPSGGTIYIDIDPPVDCSFESFECGVLLTVLEGTPFPEFPAEAVVENPVLDELIFRVDGDAAFAFDMEVRAMNRRGDLGPGKVVRVEHDFRDDHGCSAARGEGTWLALLALLSVWVRRRVRD